MLNSIGFSSPSLSRLEELQRNIDVSQIVVEKEEVSEANIGIATDENTFEDKATFIKQPESFSSITIGSPEVKDFPNGED